MDLSKEVNDFMEKYYGEFKVCAISNPKVIHLARLGTNQFKKHEIATIDLPVVQRLKYISQLGTVYNVFPTARHTRFDHTLGVSIIAKKMWDSLSENESLKGMSQESKEYHLNNLRMAAILHDIGHGPFSHVSETALKYYPQIRTEADRLHAKPHEVLGYYMIRSKVFRDFIEDLCINYDVSLNVDTISDYIIGTTEKPTENQFIADIINGPFDADKIDYIVRDSDFSGVTMSLGIDRLLLAIGAEEIKTEQGQCKKLILHEKGIQPFEQLLFAKITLYSTIYNHQKVRAIDCMVTAILRKIIRENISFNGFALDSPVDILRLDDYDLLRPNTTDSKVNKLCEDLKKRETFKRSLVISPKTISNKPKKKQIFCHELLKLMSWSEYTDSAWNFDQELANEIGDGCTEFDVAIDLPETTGIRAAEEKIIKIGNNFVSLNKIFPTAGWLEAYISNRWMGHIFSADDYRDKAYSVGKELLENKLGLKFNELAKQNAKFGSRYQAQKKITEFPSAYID